MSLVSFPSHQYSEADSSSAPHIFDWIEVQRIRRLFLLPLKVNLEVLEPLEACSSIMTPSFRIVISDFFFGHFLLMIGLVETTHQRQRVYIKSGLIRADRKIINHLFVDRTFFTNSEPTNNSLMHYFLYTLYLK